MNECAIIVPLITMFVTAKTFVGSVLQCTSPPMKAQCPSCVDALKNKAGHISIRQAASSHAIFESTMYSSRTRLHIFKDSDRMQRTCTQTRTPRAQNRLGGL